VGYEYLYGRCWTIFGGTNEIQRNIIAKGILSPETVS
jgi:alkylation response protein AidB-like acyl-CoA dehydrogenase